MLHRCDKCGATTRWYDEKCPGCGAAQAVETPTAPIALPRFAPSSRRDEKAPDATKVVQEETKREPETSATQEVAQEEPKREPETPATQEKTTETDDEPTETLPRLERSQRLDAFWRAVDAWRLTFASETASVTLPRGRAARYALGVLFELVVCPPCAILAAYFFTRAIFADRRADYHGALVETEKTRRTLAVGLGVFAAFLCAFIFYVQSQEVALPTESGPTSQLFRK